MTVNQILSTKGNNVYSIIPTISVYDAIKVMGEKNIGAILVICLLLETFFTLPKTKGVVQNISNIKAIRFFFMAIKIINHWPFLL